MDDETWGAVLSSMAGETAPATEPDAEVSVPDATTTPTDETQAIVAEATPDVETSAAGDPTTVAEAMDAPPPIDWNNPELRAVAEKAARLDEMQRVIDEQKRVQAAEQFTQDLTDLSDGDPERHQQITGLLARAITPIAQQARDAVSAAEFESKRAAALFVAMKATIPDEQLKTIVEDFKELMAVEGPDMMELKATSKRNAKAGERVAALEAQNAELQRQLAAARELTSRGGVDAVDGGGGGPAETLSREDQMRVAANTPGGFSDYWAAMWKKSNAA